MATGSAPSADSISLDFTKFTDDETWLLAVDDGTDDKTQQTTEEWLAGALDNVHVSSSKTVALSRVLESRRKKNRRGTNDDDPSSSTTNPLHSVSEENGKNSKSNNHNRLSMNENDDTTKTYSEESDDEEEFFDAPTTFVEEKNNAHGPTNVIEFQPECSNTPATHHISNYVTPNIISNPNHNGVINGNANSKSVSYSNNKIMTTPQRPNVRRGLAPAMRSTSQTRQTSPNYSTVNAMRRSPNSGGNNGIQNNSNKSLTTQQPSSNNSLNSSGGSPNSSLTFLDMSRKAEEQEKKLKEELMHAESRPASSASNNLNGDISKVVVAAANISTSKSVDFNTAIQQLTPRPTTSSGTPSRIPTLRYNFPRGSRLSTHPSSRPLASPLVTAASKIKTTSASASSLDNKPNNTIELPMSARSTASQPPPNFSNTSSNNMLLNDDDDPWGENCF